MTLAIRKRKPRIHTGFPVYSGIDQLLREIWHEDPKPNGNGNSEKSYYPVKCNIAENKDSFLIELALPGFTRKDVKIELDKDILTISSNDLEEKEEKTFRLREFKMAPFSRSFNLSNKVDQEKINAQFEDGILTITLPKRAELKPRNIHVK
ncbi:MAG: Hsp20/alpha crystallin family protein [Melioribacteraceae bacterium]|nr:Hsp20/alpha crystallin family protein [Melioribacteraceae bacterium]